MTKRILAAGLAAALLAGCSPMSDGVAPAGMADMTPEARNAYVAMAAASDLFEIQTGEMAVQRARSPQVRRFGQMLVDHHRQTTQQLMAAAQASGVSPPSPVLLPMQRTMIERLQRTGPGNFDRVFARQQVQAHQMALALHNNYARRGDAPALRSTAGAAVPIIQQHLREAQRLAR
jgi:putative membrane protein